MNKGDLSARISAPAALLRGHMISLKKYLDSPLADTHALLEPEETDLLSVAISAYGSALLEMGNCSLDACPGLGDELKRGLRWPRRTGKCKSICGIGEGGQPGTTIKRPGRSRSCCW
jgi:hypothetical protein